MTLKEWADLPDDVPGELVDGVLVEEEMPDLPHEMIVILLAQLFGWVTKRGGLVLASDYKYAVAPKRGRKPDLSVYLPGSPTPRIKDPFGTVPPDIAVEIITPRPRDARRDRVEKTVEYARFGIRWYWLVDPALRSIEILELGPKRRYTVVASLRSGKLSVPGCKGLKFDLDELWAHVDRVAT